MGSRLSVLLLTTFVALLVAAGVAAAQAPPAAPSAAAPVTVLEPFSSPHPELTVGTDNTGFPGGKPWVAVRHVSYVPGQIGDAMKVDFSIIGGHWYNMIVQLNDGVPVNLSGQTELDVTLKADFADTGGAQSVTVALNLPNGAVYTKGLALTKRWKTYALPLDATGLGWDQNWPYWGWKGPFTLDQVATITFFTSPAKSGRHAVWFDDLAVQGGPLQPPIDPDAPVLDEFTGIPYALGQAVDDLGWHLYDDRYASIGDYQKLIWGEPATLADYQDVVDIGKAAGTRLMTVWIMQDLDRNDTCAKAKYNTPVAQYDMTEDGTSWHNHVSRGQERVMNLVKHNAAYMEFGMHGVSHEHFRNGVVQRAEYAHIDESNPGHATTWGWADMNLKAECYQALLRQWFSPEVLRFPVAEVPPAHAYYYRKNDPHTTGALLAKYGVKYVNGGMGVSTMVSKGYLIDHGVVFINRAYGTNWDWVGATPWEGYWNDFDKPYYPSDSYGWVEAHFPNMWGAKDKWVAYLTGMNDSSRHFLARNSAEASWQYLYHKGGTMTGAAGAYTIDLTGVDPQAYTYDLLGPMVLKVYVGDGDVSSATLTGGAQVFGYWKDTYGYAYLLVGKNGSPMGRLDPATYDLTTSFGASTMPAYVDLTGATYNVYGFSAGADSASLRLLMYGTQTVKVKLPFAPSSVVSSNPRLMVKSWSYEAGFLTMQVQGVRITGQPGTITVTR